VRSNEGKSTVRNWLACKAPVVAGVTGAPADAATIGDVVAPGKVTEVAATYASIYTNILASCTSCHTPGGAFPGLDLSSQAVAYTSLVNKDTSAGSVCTGKGKLVQAGNCKASVLYQKLQPTPTCGSRMPLGMDPVGDSAQAALCAWIDAGALQQ
jgi:hypothetical protein